MTKYILGFLLLTWNMHVHKHYQDATINFSLFVCVGFIILGLWEEYAIKHQKTWKKYEHEKIMIKYLFGFLFLSWWVHLWDDSSLEETFSLLVGLAFIISGLWEEYGTKLKEELNKFRTTS